MAPRHEKIFTTQDLKNLFDKVTDYGTNYDLEIVADMSGGTETLEVYEASRVLNVDGNETVRLSLRTKGQEEKDLYNDKTPT